jgi:DNA-binding SARP family transcriptional activator
VPGWSFQVFGGVRAWRDGVEVDLGARRQRAVLAALLVRAGEPVPTATVIDFVWAQPPSTAAAVVHTYVRGLRRALDPDRPARRRDGLLRSAHGHYLLQVGPGQVDLPRFRELASTARAELSAGRSATARRAMSEALALWPAGTPVAPEATGAAAYTSGWLTGLEQQWLDCAAAAAGLELAAGEAGAALPWISEAAAAAPLHEPLQARLIDAYQLAGRGAEALAAFQVVRRRLRDDLGADPGPELRAAHQRALRGEDPRPSRLD